MASGHSMLMGHLSKETPLSVIGIVGGGPVSVDMVAAVTSTFSPAQVLWADSVTNLPETITHAVSTLVPVQCVVVHGGLEIVRPADLPELVRIGKSLPGPIALTGDSPDAATLLSGQQQARVYRAPFGKTPAQARDRQAWVAQRAQCSGLLARMLDDTFGGHEESLAMAADYHALLGPDLSLEAVAAHVSARNEEIFVQALVNLLPAEAVGAARRMRIDAYRRVCAQVARTILRLSAAHEVTQRFPKVTREALIVAREKADWLQANWRLAARYDPGETARRMDLLADTSIALSQGHTRGALEALVMMW